MFLGILKYYLNLQNTASHITYLNLSVYSIVDSFIHTLGPSYTISIFVSIKWCIIFHCRLQTIMFMISLCIFYNLKH